MNYTQLAKALGVFSIALGLHETLQTQTLAYELNMEDQKELIKLYGAREIGAGVGILLQKRPTFWVWTRVAGDVLDILALIPGLNPGNIKKPFVTIALGMVAGITALDILCAVKLSGGAE